MPCHAQGSGSKWVLSYVGGGAVHRHGLAGLKWLSQSRAVQVMAGQGIWGRVPANLRSNMFQGQMEWRNRAPCMKHLELWSLLALACSPGLSSLSSASRFGAGATSPCICGHTEGVGRSNRLSRGHAAHSACSMTQTVTSRLCYDERQ